MKNENVKGHYIQQAKLNMLELNSTDGEPECRQAGLSHKAWSNSNLRRKKYLTVFSKLIRRHSR